MPSSQNVAIVKISFDLKAMPFLIIAYCSILMRKGIFDWQQRYQGPMMLHHEQMIPGKKMHPLITFMAIALWLLI